MTRYEAATAVKRAADNLCMSVKDRPRGHWNDQIEDPDQARWVETLVTALADYKSATIASAQVRSKKNPVSTHIWLLAGTFPAWDHDRPYVDQNHTPTEVDSCLCGHGGKVHPWEWTDGHAAVDSATGGVTCRACLDRWEATQ